MSPNSTLDYIKGFLGVTYYTTFFIAEIPVSIFLVVFLLCFTDYWFLFILYVVWMIIDDETSERGSRPIEICRSGRLVKWAPKYFPISYVKSADYELDKTRNYMIAVVPHGFHCSTFYIGCVSRFNGLFPNHETYSVQLKLAFRLPFIREMSLLSGAVSASEKSLDYLLGKPGGGNIVGLCPGGAEEALYLNTGGIKLVTRRRKGFVRVALKNGSPLIPCISFGELEVMDHFRGEKLVAFQKWVKKHIGFVPIMPKGRGFIQPSFFPMRKPVYLVCKLFL